MDLKEQALDLMEHLCFGPPTKLTHMKGWYIVYVKSTFSCNLDNVFETLGISFAKRKQFLQKCIKGFTPKEEIEIKQYISMYTTEITAVLQLFSVTVAPNL